MSLSDLALPQCWMVGVIVLVLAIKSWRQKWCAPSLDDFVELVAYFAGFYGTKVVFVEALKQKDRHDIGVALMAAGALLAYVSARGVWRTYNRQETAEPTKPNPQKDEP